MRKLILLAGIAALTAAVPAAADAKGRGQGRGQAAHADQQRPANANHARNRNAERRAGSGFIDRNHDGIDDRARNRHGGAACPPGLANRTPACVPPGQARRAFREGQLVPRNYGYYTTYDRLLSQVPEAYQTRIPTGYNYIYNGSNVYLVDRRTRIITSIINLLR